MTNSYIVNYIRVVVRRVLINSAVHFSLHVFHTQFTINILRKYIKKVIISTGIDYWFTKLI